MFAHEMRYLDPALEALNNEHLAEEFGKSFEGAVKLVPLVKDIEEEEELTRLFEDEGVLKVLREHRPFQSVQMPDVRHLCVAIKLIAKSAKIAQKFGRGFESAVKLEPFLKQFEQNGRCNLSRSIMGDKSKAEVQLGLLKERLIKDELRKRLRMYKDRQKIPQRLSPCQRVSDTFWSLLRVTRLVR